MKATPQDVARHYDTWTPNYLAAFGSCIQANRPASDEEFLTYLLNRIGLEPGVRVLDAGCGICGPARFFAARAGVHIEALTISTLQADLAQQRNTEENLDGQINVQVGDFHHLSSYYPANSFDIVYFLESLSHSAEPAQVLSSVYKVLKPKGLVYIKDFFELPAKEEAARSAIKEIVARVDAAFAVVTPKAAELTGILDSLSFQKVFAEPPAFTPDISKWQLFEHVHKFGLYTNDIPCQWAEWIEFKYRKPERE